MSELVYDIMEYLEAGTLSFQEIAWRLEVPVEWVIEAAETMAV